MSNVCRKPGCSVGFWPASACALASCQVLGLLYTSKAKPERETAKFRFRSFDFCVVFLFSCKKWLAAESGGVVPGTGTIRDLLL